MRTEPLSLAVISSVMPTRSGDQLIVVTIGRRKASATKPATYEARIGRQVQVRNIDNSKVEIVE